MNKRGLFVTFEGGEGAGKTTLIKKLVQEILSRGLSVLTTREPGGTSLGEEIRNLLLHRQESEAPLSPYSELALFLASRSQHIREVIRPALLAQKIVLCDRFNDSSIAYQGLGRGLGMKQVQEVCHFMSEGLEPDLTFYLDLEPELGMKRAKERQTADRIESEQMSFHQKIREAYQEIHRENPRRFHLIDATATPATVFAKTMEVLGSHLG